MGLGRTVHWMAWFINSSIVMLVTIVLLVITMKYGRVLANSNPFIVFLFLVIFMVSTIMMCFLISVFFSRANVAAACGGIIFFVTYLPYSLVRWFEAFMTTSQKAFSVSIYLLYEIVNLSTVYLKFYCLELGVCCKLCRE